MAHVEKHRFGDGQLYADLRGFSASGEPAEPAAVLGGFLRQLGVAESDLPTGLDDQAALYRARLEGRRVLVLDDAATAEHVRPLLPGSPTCAVLVTSRRALDGLDGVQLLPLGVFTPTDSRALLDRVVGPARTGTEPAAAARLADLCGHLPLAVALVARRLRSRSAWRPAAGQHLADHRLAVEAAGAGLEIPADLPVRRLPGRQPERSQVRGEARQLRRLNAPHPAAPSSGAQEDRGTDRSPGPPAATGTRIGTVAADARRRLWLSGPVPDRPASWRARHRRARLRPGATPRSP